MIDKQYNPKHCDGCKKPLGSQNVRFLLADGHIIQTSFPDTPCGGCQDAFEEDEVKKPKTLFGKQEPAGEKYVMRYAQRNALSELSRMARIG